MIRVREIPTPTAGFVGTQTPQQILASYELVAEHGPSKSARENARKMAERLRAEVDHSP